MIVFADDPFEIDIKYGRTVGIGVVGEENFSVYRFLRGAIAEELILSFSDDQGAYGYGFSRMSLIADKMVKGHAKVALTSLGADETICSRTMFNGEWYGDIHVLELKII